MIEHLKLYFGLEGSWEYSGFYQEKEALIKFLFHSLDYAEYENVTITNKTREITFKKGENSYKLTLTATRKPKNT